MKTKLAGAFTLPALLAMLAGCTVLQSEFYPGERVENLYELLPKQSAWVSNEDAILHLRVVDSNTLVLAGLDWENQAGEFKKERLNVIVSRIGKQYFVSATDEDEELYVINRLVLPETDVDRPTSAIILNIDKDKILADGKAGKVKLHESECCGKKKLETILTGTKEEQDEYFRANPNSLWDLENASTIWRVTAME